MPPTISRKADLRKPSGASTRWGIRPTPPLSRLAWSGWTLGTTHRGRLHGRARRRIFSGADRIFSAAVGDRRSWVRPTWLPPPTRIPQRALPSRHAGVGYHSYQRAAPATPLRPRSLCRAVARPWRPLLISRLPATRTFTFNNLDQQANGVVKVWVAGYDGTATVPTSC